MSIMVEYGSASGRVFSTPAAYDDDGITIVFRRGSRDDRSIGSCHTIEHMLVAKSQEILRRWGSVTGYTTHDVTAISFRFSEWTQQVLSGVYKWFELCLDPCAMYNVESFAVARNQITQELTLQAFDLKTSLSNLPVRSLWNQTQMGRPIDSLESEIGFEEFSMDVKDWGQHHFAIFCSEPISEQITSVFFGTSNLVTEDSLVTDPSATYEPRDLRVTWRGLNNTFVRSLGLGISNVTPRDILYSGIVSGIWNSRLEATLRSLGSYVNLCFPKVHRGETAIFLVYSGLIVATKEINVKVANIIDAPIADADIRQTARFLEKGAKSANRRGIYELKAMFLSDIFDKGLESLSVTSSQVNDWVASLPLHHPGTVWWS